MTFMAQYSQKLLWRFGDLAAELHQRRQRSHRTARLCLKIGLSAQLICVFSHIERDSYWVGAGNMRAYISSTMALVP
jgi:hypothetical protein